MDIDPHHDDGAGAAPLAEDRRNYNHTCVESSNIIYQEYRLTSTHSKQQRNMHYTIPRIEYPESSIYIVVTR